MVFCAPKQKIKSYKNKMNIKKKLVKNSMFPLSAIALFCATVFYWNNQNYGLALEYNGQKIATVPNEEVYEKANHMILDQLNSNDKSKVENTAAQIKITPVSKKECCESPHEVKNKIIEKSQEVITEGFGIYIDNKLIAVGKNESEIKTILAEILDEKKSQNPELEVEFSEKVEVVNGIFSPEEIKNKDEIKKILVNGMETVTEYIVKEDDTITSISEKFGITPEELLSSNNVKDESVFVDDKLIIKTVEKILKVKTFKVESEEKEIPYSTEKTENPSQDVSWENLTQEGKDGKETLKYKIEVENGIEVKREELDHRIIEESTARKIIVGTKNKPSEKENKSELNWPVPFTKKITSPYGKRGGSFHQGIDIACSGVGGKEILASESGTIKYAGYNKSGYGNHIIIDHGNGKQTLYGHCQKLHVSQNQKVKKGQKIGTVGSTGDSTGNHLHFEVRVNGAAQNPQKYV